MRDKNIKKNVKVKRALGQWSADSQGDHSGRVDELHAIGEQAIPYAGNGSE